MQVRSNIITSRDIHAALDGIDDVWIDSDGIREFQPRAFAIRGFEFYLEGAGERHVRARNGRDGHGIDDVWIDSDGIRHAATWDDIGVMMARLFAIDPYAKIARYVGLEGFLQETARYQPEGARAPWLKRTPERGLLLTVFDNTVRTPGYTWPDEAQRVVDNAKLAKKHNAELRRQARALRAEAAQVESLIS